MATKPATVDCANCTDKLRPSGTGTFVNAPVHVITGNTGCANGRTAEPELWGVLPTAKNAWAYEATPFGYGCS